LVGGKKFLGLYLNVKKEPKWDSVGQYRWCVMALAVIFLDRDEFSLVFCVVRRNIPLVKTRLDKKGRIAKNI